MDNNVLYEKIINNPKYQPIVDCLTEKINNTIKKKFIAKEQLLERCENDEIIYNLSENTLTENQLLAMNNKELKHKNSFLLSQNIKYRECLSDNHSNNNEVLKDIEIDFLNLFSKYLLLK